MIIEFATPYPYCLLPIYHPARAHVPYHKTDIRRTFTEHAPIEHGDDYDRVERDAWLETGGFK